MEDWNRHAEREIARYHDGLGRLPADPDERQRALTRVGNAAYGAGLSLLMRGEDADGSAWLLRAAERYRDSYETAPPGSWGRPIATIKARILAGDRTGAEEAARWALDEGAGETDSPIGRYAATLACLVLGEWEAARVHADEIRDRDDFPRDVADALAFVAAGDVVDYVEAVESVLRSFEAREEYLEDVPVADTVLVLQGLAGDRGIAAAADLASPLLPG